MPFLLCLSSSQLLVHIYSHTHTDRHNLPFLHQPYFPARSFHVWHNDREYNLINTYVLLQHNFRIRYLWKWLLLLLLYCIGYSIQNCWMRCSLLLSFFFFFSLHFYFIFIHLFHRRAISRAREFTMYIARTPHRPISVALLPVVTLWYLAYECLQIYSTICWNLSYRNWKEVDKVDRISFPKW